VFATIGIICAFVFARLKGLSTSRSFDMLQKNPE